MTVAATSPGAGVPPARLQWSVARAQRAAAALRPSWACMCGDANDNGCGLISQPTWNGTPCAAWPGVQDSSPWGVQRCWGPGGLWAVLGSYALGWGGP